MGMKDWKTIADMRPDQLEEAAADIRVPEGLEDRLAALVEDLDHADQVLAAGKTAGRSRKIWISLLGTAAAVTLVAGLFRMQAGPRLKDTYDDPALAYAEVEKALGRIASKMQYGTEVLSESREKMEKPLKMLQ